MDHWAAPYRGTDVLPPLLTRFEESMGWDEGAIQYLKKEERYKTEMFWPKKSGVYSSSTGL